MIVENEAYTRFGPGIARMLLNKLALRLKVFQREGQPDAATLHAYQQGRWSGSVDHLASKATTPMDVNSST